MHENLDLRHTSRELDEFMIRYKGTGVRELTMCFDDFRIRRNVFDTEVKYGKGLCLTGFDHLLLPLSNVTLDKGTVECWVRMGVDSLGRDAFGNLYAPTIFTINNNNNDIIALKVRPTAWFEVLAGNLRRQSIFKLEDLPNGFFIGRGELFHIALVWSNDGTGMDNNDTVRLYINNKLRLASSSTWDIKDTKLSYFKLGGGVTQSTHVFESFSSCVFDNLKVYNFCKDNFTINKEDIEQDYVYLPETFIEISKDNNNFHGLGSIQLPFIYEQVPAGESVQVYVRADKTKNFDASHSTAQIIIDWLTTV